MYCRRAALLILHLLSQSWQQIYGAAKSRHPISIDIYPKRCYQIAVAPIANSNFPIPFYRSPQFVGLQHTITNN
jgi:hypothetical protein